MLLISLSLAISCCNSDRTPRSSSVSSLLPLTFNTANDCYKDETSIKVLILWCRLWLTDMDASVRGSNSSFFAFRQLLIGYVQLSELCESFQALHHTDTIMSQIPGTLKHVAIAYWNEVSANGQKVLTVKNLRVQNLQLDNILFIKTAICCMYMYMWHIFVFAAHKLGPLTS